MKNQGGVLKEIEERLDYSFTDLKLLKLALTHSAYANEKGRPGKHNERLEFLGDATLELCVSSELYRRYPEAREGEMTTMRARLVREGTLAAIALETGLDKALKLGAGMEKQGGRMQPSILADALEAVLGAIFLDGGYAAAKKTVSRLFAPLWPENWRVKPGKSDKSRLQELCWRLFKAFPAYAAEASGPENAKTFEALLRLPDGREFRACNLSCKKAEEDAAALALKALASEK